MSCTRTITLVFISLESFLASHFPLIIFHTISCPLNSKTLRDISMKLGTLIKHDEMMCHAKMP